MVSFGYFRSCEEFGPRELVRQAKLAEHILGDHWPPADERLEMLEEAIEVIRALRGGNARPRRWPSRPGGSGSPRSAGPSMCATDRSTARALREAAVRVLEVYHGDLRRVAEAAEESPSRLRALLTEFPRVGPAGARFYCGEAREVGM